MVVHMEVRMEMVAIDRMDIETETFTHFKLTRNDDGLDDFSYTAI